MDRRIRMISLAELFPAGDFRFHLTLRRGEPQEFFRRWDDSGRTLGERRSWLAGKPDRYSALLPEGEPLLVEFIQLCRAWNVADLATPESGATVTETTVEALRALGASLESDVLLLSPDDDGQFRLRGGVLCFPTGWALHEKLGHTLDFIHGVVPGLNPALGSSIGQFLSKLKPGVGFQRDNWGITSSDELNQHPVRALPAPASPVALDGLWLRVEHQILVALPRSRGVVFGIRISMHRLDCVAVDRTAVEGLTRALESMPQSMAAYKRLEGIRAPLIEELRAHIVT
jgi:hypothetical protein